MSKLTKVGWQFFDDGKWHMGSDTVKNHRLNTDGAGYPVRDVYAGIEQTQKTNKELLEALEQTQKVLKVWSQINEDESLDGIKEMVDSCVDVNDKAITNAKQVMGDKECLEN